MYNVLLSKYFTTRRLQMDTGWMKTKQNKTKCLADILLNKDIFVYFSPNSNLNERHNNLSYFISQLHNMFQFLLGFGNLFLNIAYTFLSDYEDESFIAGVCRMSHSAWAHLWTSCKQEGPLPAPHRAVKETINVLVWSYTGTSLMLLAIMMCPKSALFSKENEISDRL